MPIHELALWSCPSSHAASAALREAADLAVAQAVVHEREKFAGDGDAGLVAAAPLGDALEVVA